MALTLIALQEALKTQPLLTVLLLGFVAAPLAGALGGFIELRLARRRAQIAD
ncbi:MAG TPA: hypothetical protein VGR87_11010 [Candidatus Limnocylindria bacterium]|jgi:hypothetical protein|nr:hypothetical protein [Candidatus Limnocylindria bacterium]